MAQPTYYTEGTTARSRDTKLRVWTKALGVKQNLLGASAKAANNPKQYDTIRVIKLKLLHSFRNSSYGQQ